MEDENDLAAVAAQAKEEAISDADTTEQVETTEEPAPEQAEAHAEPEQPEQSNEDDAPKKRNRKSAGARIGELTRKLREAEAERDALKAQNVKPKYEDFNDPDEYEDAKLDYRIRQREIAQREAAAEASRKQIDETVKREWQGRVAEYKAQAPDFEQVAYTAPIADELADVIMTMEDGPAVAYHLGKNPHIAISLSDMDPRSAAVEIGKIAARMSQPQRRIASKAPPPVQPVTGSGGSTSPDPEKMSYAEYRRWRMGK